MPKAKSNIPKLQNKQGANLVCYAIFKKGRNFVSFFVAQKC
jgi:hypothetical protein